MSCLFEHYRIVLSDVIQKHTWSIAAFTPNLGVQHVATLAHMLRQVTLWTNHSGWHDCQSSLTHNASQPLDIENGVELVIDKDRNKDGRCISTSFDTLRSCAAEFIAFNNQLKPD